MLGSIALDIIFIKSLQSDSDQYNRGMETHHFESLYPVDTRFFEIEKVLQYIKEGKSPQVLSLPGGGRSNFLGLLAYNKALRRKHLGDDEQWFHFVDIDFSTIKNKSVLEAYKLIFLEIVDSLSERNLQEEYAHTKHLLKESLQFNDELVLFQGLKKTIDFLCLEKKLTIVLLFDRFEDYLPMLQPAFFTNMRILRDHAKYHFSVVFSLTRPLEDIAEPNLFQDFSEFIQGNLVYLDLYDKIGLSFRIDYIENVSKKKLPEEMKESIVKMTGGHPKLTRLCVEAALQSDVILNLSALARRDRFQDLKQISEEMLKLVQHDNMHKVLETIWESFTPAEKTHFLKNLFAKEYADEHTRYLEAVGLVRDKTITIPLFSTFVDEKKKTTLTTTTHITYNQDTNTITHGDQILSDDLTATELRLLTYFLLNTSQILERNTIIASVWKDNKSLAGVTDQALDQLIFRLRRKIEEDPNNPTHLITVKGRGFKFTP